MQPVAVRLTVLTVLMALGFAPFYGEELLKAQQMIYRRFEVMGGAT